MSELDQNEEAHPRRTLAFFGHHAAEQALLAAYRGGRIPHAFILGGPPGIGKATLAYRMARFVLAHPDPSRPEVRNAASLEVSADHPVTRRMARKAQGDLLVLERALNERTGKPYTVIRVEDVRRTLSFFGATAGEGGWRICIIDTADELQYPQASNALLKVLEEPPPRALFLLVSHAPGRLLPTIRSRCRRLDLRPLAASDVARALAQASGRPVDDADVAAAAAAAEGSVAKGLVLLDPQARALRQQVTALLDALPRTDPRALHALGDALGPADSESLAGFVDTVNAWLSRRLHQGGDSGLCARLAEAWEQFNRTARDVDTYNLDRRPFVFATFGLLAETARG